MGCDDIPVTLRKLLIYLETTDRMTDTILGMPQSWSGTSPSAATLSSEGDTSTRLQLPLPDWAEGENWYKSHVSCCLEVCLQHLLHLQCMGKDTAHGFRFWDRREIFHGYCLILVPSRRRVKASSRKVKASQLQGWYWEPKWFCMRTILWRGFLICAEVWGWRRKSHCLNCRGEWKRKVRQGDGRNGEFPRWVRCLKKYPALIAVVWTCQLIYLIAPSCQLAGTANNFSLITNSLGLIIL